MSLLTVGDRIRLSGGYEHEPVWLEGKPFHTGLVCAFIPGQNKTEAAVIQLGASIAVDDASGEFAVLELRYVDADWGQTGTVHIELCASMPELKAWQDRPKGKWVESHATYTRVLSEILETEMPTDTCPRCHGPFHCGAKDAHCDCFDLKLSDALQAQLKKDYESCLCVACLRELAQREASAHP